MAPAPAQEERRRAGSARGAAAQEHEQEQDARRAGSPLGYLDEGASALVAEADSDASSSSGDSADASSTSSWDSAREAHEAQLQWDESVRQLQALLNLVAVPWVSRYFGRKWAYSRASPLPPPSSSCGSPGARLTRGGARAQCLSGTSTSGSASGSGSGPSRSTRPSRGGEPEEEQGRFVDLPLALHSLVLSLCARES